MQKRTKILEAHSRKQATVYWQAICVNHLLAVRCMYQFLLNSGIFYSVDIYYRFFLKENCSLVFCFLSFIFCFEIQTDKEMY